MNEEFTSIVVGKRLSEYGELLKLLRSSGYSIVTVRTIPELESSLEVGNSIAIAFVDLKDTECSGYEAMRVLKERSPETQIVVISQRHSTKEAVEAQNRGAFCYFSDPLDIEEFLFLIAKASIVYELALNNRDLKTALFSTSETNFIGQSIEARKVLNQVEKIAGVNTTVLVTGESGTGKTTLARLIHSRSDRSSKPFISLSCAAIPRELLEAELFGYERGAFTGAIARKIGSIELANGGTLFLDEIGDLPLELQPKLLTFLQDRQIRRVGSTKLIQLDVRIIAATNRDLQKMVHSKLFREDLYFRMHVVNIKLPPLRARRDDIPRLSENVLTRLAKARGIKRFQLSKEAGENLLSYAWPGNIRELENVLERASLFCQDNQITPDELELAADVQLPTSAPEMNDEIMTLAEIERVIIERRVQFHGGNKQLAAQSLGISLKTIYNKMRSYGLS